jgi:cytochrome c oxidase subunit 2
MHSVNLPAGPQAAVIHGLWELMLWTAIAVFVVTMLAVALALVRPPTRPDRDAGQTTARAVSLAMAATVLVLSVLLVKSVLTGRDVGTTAPGETIITVTGHQWWWEVEYWDRVPSRRTVTANEIHIPVGRPVVFNLTSRDVIHSFWAPSLQGKRDLIPGHRTTMGLQADQVGQFRSQCAEFCGMQHAHMALTITVEPIADLERWLDSRRQPAREPNDAAQRHGQQVFMSTRCAACHRIAGTPALGQVAPDLTHIASRPTLGAGTLPNTREHLAQWIRDPQAVKPGNQMPATDLPPEDLDALVSYLESLR